MIVPPFEVTLKDQRTIILRSIKADDAEAFLEHLKIAHGESYRNLNRGREHWEKVTVSEQAETLKKFEDHEFQFFIGAFDQEKIVAGLGIFTPGTGAVALNGHLGISIRQSHSGVGLGALMMDLSIKTAKDAGLHRIELSVRTYNDPAIALYEKSGFRRVGTLKEVALIDGKFVDEYLYEKVL